MKKILFFDDFMITRQRNVRRQFHQPRWLPEPIYRDDTTRFGLSDASIVPAPGGGYYLFYSAAIPGNVKILSLARSKDALHWERASFESSPFPGFPQALYPKDGESRGESMHVHFDPDDPDPSRRYKLLESYKGPKPACCRIAYSANALDWQVDDKHPFSHFGSDTYNTIVRNRRTGNYQIILRRAVGDRRILVTESRDLKTWTEPRIALHPDPSLPPGTTYYSMPHFAYGEMFLGLLYIYQTVEIDERHDKMVATTETELAYSYDGIAWNRTFRPFMPLRDLGNYGGRSMYGMAMMQREKDIVVYAVGSLREHHIVTRPAGEPARDALVAGTLRRDGFVSFTNVAGPGEITTDCLYPRSPQLSLNVHTPFGGVRVQVCDLLCKPLTGYTFEDCEEIRGDHLSISPRWRGNTDLTDAIRQMSTAEHYPGWLRIQVQLHQADLYTIEGDFGVTLRSGGKGCDYL